MTNSKRVALNIPVSCIDSLLYSAIMVDKTIYKTYNNDMCELLNSLWTNSSSECKLHLLGNIAFRKRIEYWDINYDKRLTNFT